MLRPSLLASLLLAASSAAAQPIATPQPGAPAVTPATSAPSYVDGGRRVEVLAGTHQVKPGLVPITLRYPDGRTFDVAVDDTAIVTTGDIERLEREAGVTRVQLLMPQEGLWTVRGGPGESGAAIAVRLAARVQAGGLLQGAEPNLYLEKVRYGEPRTPNDPGFPMQWFFDDLKMTEAWGLEWGSPEVGIAVLDTGCDSNHQDLRAKIESGFDVIDDDLDPTILSREQGASHGTACAGLAAASTDNGTGVAGACPECKLHCVRLLPIPEEVTPLSNDIRAFQFVITSGAAVSSNSWGYSRHIPVPTSLRKAIESAFDNGRGGKGTVIVFAAGNENREVLDDEMLAVRGVIGVGAITHYQEVTSYSNRGNSVDLVAPVGSVTTDLSGSYGDTDGDYMGSFGGTSSACPIVAGIAGLLVSAAPDKTAQEIEDVLLATTTPALYALPDEWGHDQMYGYGVVNPVQALKAVKGIVDPPPVLPEDGAGGDAQGCGGCAGGPAGLLALAGLAALFRRRAR